MRNTEKWTQVEGEASSASGEPDVELDPRTLNTTARAKGTSITTEAPRCPVGSLFFLTLRKLFIT